MKRNYLIGISTLIVLFILCWILYNSYFSKKAIYESNVRKIEEASEKNNPNLEDLSGFYKSEPYLNTWQQSFICQYEIVMENKGCGIKPYTYYKFNNQEGTDGYIFIDDYKKLGVGANGSCNEQNYGSNTLYFDPVNKRLVTPTFILNKTSEILEVRDAKMVNSKNLLESMIRNQSNGAISLESFDKVDGKIVNINVYQLFFTATIIINEEIWKPGNAVEGWFHNFTVLKSQPQGWDSYLAGDPKNYKKGQRIKIKGKSTLEKREKGWTVIDISV